MPLHAYMNALDTESYYSDKKKSQKNITKAHRLESENWIPTSIRLQSFVEKRQKAHQKRQKDSQKKDKKTTTPKEPVDSSRDALQAKFQQRMAELRAAREKAEEKIQQKKSDPSYIAYQEAKQQKKLAEREAKGSKPSIKADKEAAVVKKEKSLPASKQKDALAQKRPRGESVAPVVEDDEDFQTTQVISIEEKMAEKKKKTMNAGVPMPAGNKKKRLIAALGEIEKEKKAVERAGTKEEKEALKHSFAVAKAMDRAAGKKVKTDSARVKKSLKLLQKKK